MVLYCRSLHETFNSAVNHCIGLMNDFAKLFRRRPNLTQLYHCPVLTGPLRVLCLILLTPTRVVGLRTGLLCQSNRWHQPRPFREVRVPPQPSHKVGAPTPSRTRLYASHSGTLMTRAVSVEARLGASVAVIGAGSAGLAAARVLRDAGKVPFAPFNSKTRNRCSPRLQRRIPPVVE